MKPKLAFFAFFIFITVFIDSVQAVHPVVLETKLGDIKGTEFFFLSKKIRTFFGVPFAEPAVEDFRFRKPREKKQWRGLYDATKPANACFQTRDNYNTSFWGSEMWNANTQISEDCLYLNIWAPADAYNLTVMVWFFGGGFYSGSPSLSIYDGKALTSTQNVIVVNINYRLGPFGFLYLGHPDAPGNMGLLDQQLALHWVRQNIVSFGGNPDKVAVFGQSAGAASIVAHLIAPGSRGLFKNAILQSGSLENTWAINSPFRAKQKSEKLLELVGCNKTTVDTSMACLRLVSPEQLSLSTWNISLTYLEFPFVIVSRDKHFFGHLDAHAALREGDFNRDVNLMIGMNKDEGNYWNIYQLPQFFDKADPPELNRTEFDFLIDRTFSIQPDIIRSAAKYIYSDPNCTDHGRKTRFYAGQMNQIVGDYFFSCDSLWLADQFRSIPRVKSSSPQRKPGKVFVYHFTQSSSANPWPKWTGAMHGYEIEYVFGIPLSYSKNYKRREQIFSRKIMQFWASFAKNGTPKLRVLKNSEHWPEFNEQNHYRWMQLRSGSNIRPIKPKKQVECQFWRRVKDTEYTAYLTQEYSSSSLTTYSYWLLLYIPLFIFQIF
ncbi:Carboxylic ester hydrolase [Caenorhabditis elegans]|uniref:Carboxylic ester hydrolase n=1 Tax=Caenorhabditis elegans TaxID=6239 RepID=G5EDN1_CAEEL|nr:Carboxylic ester hydrolase [Caenorhabditis elegans]AAC14017.1 acetylcholinesterase [Caenorhabditis elegans]CAB54444.2 Carboxylic ester hydrolase [Caenorhabditis elegans]|eukprot:NP_496962.1 Carboxylic ester hydrolase [Caenorhabditis elegans]